LSHVLSVGEINDNAIDPCLRNAGKIALSIGVFSLVGDAINVIVSRAGADAVLKNMHLRIHATTSTSGWIVALGYVSSFVVFPIVEAALFVLFDHALRGETISLRQSYRMPFGRAVNIIVASFLAAIYSSAPAGVVIIAYLIAVGLTQSTAVIVVGGLIALAIIVWLLGLLAAGVAMGFARVALDGDRVIRSLRFGVVTAFSKANRRRALGVGIPLALLLLIGNFGGYYAGIIVFGWTGVDAANVIVQSIGDVASWSVTAAVATIYYRNLTTSVAPAV
jgi:hypothetical protein